MQFNVKRDILALDFDGVIANSINECLVTAHNSYVIFDGGTRIESESELDTEIKNKAVQLRNYIRNGEDYVYIMHILAQGEKVENQQEFDGFTERYAHLRKQFFDIFFNERLDFATRQPATWSGLNPLYDGIADYLAHYPCKENLYIVTTKKLVFVEKILGANQIELFPENLFDTNENRSKRKIIADIVESRSQYSEHLYFIDDQIDTLLKVRPTGVHCLLAEWGYNNEKQIDLAQDKNIPVLELEHFYRQFHYLKT